MIKAVLFDMDGVLFDTERMYYDTLIGIMRDFGYDMTREFFIRTLGIPGAACRQMYDETYGDDFPFDAVHTQMFDAVRKMVQTSGTPLKPFVKECLQELKARGLHLVLATSCPRFAVEDYFSLLPELDALLDGKVCGDEVEHGKPAPDIFIKAAQLAGHAPADCLGVEDSFSGLQAICASGAYAVMIPDMLPYSDAAAPYTDAVLHSLAELPALVDRINKR